MPPPRKPCARPPALPAGQAHVWRVRADTGAPEDVRWRALLAPAERERLDRFHFADDAKREAVSRGSLRLLLGAYLGRPPAEVAFAAEAQGKPVLAGSPAGGRIEFNVSHSGEWAVLAFARARRVGVDLERWREIETEQILGDFFRPEEAEEWRQQPAAERPAAFFAAWTLKEAYLKAPGVGLARPMQSFRVRAGPGPAALLWCAEDARAPERWSLARLDLAPGYSAALAAENEISGVASFTLPRR